MSDDDLTSDDGVAGEPTIVVPADETPVPALDAAPDSALDPVADPAPTSVAVPTVAARSTRWGLWAAAVVGVLAVVLASLAIGRMSADDGGGTELLIVPRPVERRDLDDVLTIQGEVRREEVQTINLPVDGKVSSIAVEDGDTVESGDELFALDGRTAVAVPGDFAFFRTLDVGSDGPDVLQLERILVEAGYRIRQVDQLFTEETRTALAAWQAARGYGGATPEPSETVTVTLGGNQAGYSVGAQNTAAFTIEPAAPAAGPVRVAGPSQPTIQLTPATVYVDEGGVAELTFTSSPAPSTDTIVDLTIAGDADDGSSAKNGDYLTFDDSIVFPAGETSVTLEIPIFVDQVIEDEEQIVVSLTDQFGQNPVYVVGPSNESRVRISANGSDLVPRVSVRASDSSIDEGSSVTFTFTSTVESNEDIELDIVLSGSAANGDDYEQVLSDDVTITAGNTEATLQVRFRRDGQVEADETMTLSVRARPDYQPGSPASASVLVESSDLPEITLLGGGAIREGSSSSFTFVADAPVTADTSINYQVNGTATAGKDFETLTGTVVMRAGTTRVSVSLATIDDDVLFLPSDMVVADWPARVGVVEVDEGEFVLQGAPVLTLTEPVFTVTLVVTATERSELEIGQPVRVSLDSSATEFEGAIATLDDTAVITTAGEERYEGTIAVEGDIAAVDGAGVSIDVTLEERLGVLAVPVAAVLRSGGGDVVRVVNDAGTITRVSVTIGLIDGEWVEIVSGLKGDELVIVDVDPAAEPVAADG